TGVQTCAHPICYSNNGQEHTHSHRDLGSLAHSFAGLVLHDLRGRIGRRDSFVGWGEGFVGRSDRFRLCRNLARLRILHHNTFDAITIPVALVARVASAVTVALVERFVRTATLQAKPSFARGRGAPER